ncbi:hypothetical protein TSUD_379980 [Trifolium subterraneum]|uniref:Reverse transcriptase zinc-binding domain-containing protein n=1 Tax=Trifolium subterraneum TaxID=3900 RepID=A0A2Z6LXN0_TRISU|nr:hypothetical protein TSUD_379980 [Trifolium subterraneum]
MLPGCGYGIGIRYWHGAKYGQEGGRLRFGEGVGSHWWRSMNDVRVGAGLGDARWLLDNITRRVGDGCETRFWTDPWLSDWGEAWKWRRRLYAWEEELVVECVARLANVVLQAVPLKVTIFIWRLFLNRLPTKANLRHRGIIEDTQMLCPSLCGKVEDSNHLFFQCEVYGRIWHLIIKWLGVESALHGDIDMHSVQFSGLGFFPMSPIRWRLWLKRLNYKPSGG